MVKQAINQTANLGIMRKKRLDGWQQIPKPKANKKCFNYGKKRHYTKNCYSNSKRKPKNQTTTKEVKQIS